MALVPFTAVEGGLAILRLRHGVQKQSAVYHRGGRVFVPHGSGFVRVTETSFDDAFPTVHPDIKVLEIEGEGITIDGRQLRFKA